MSFDKSKPMPHSLVVEILDLPARDARRGARRSSSGRRRDAVTGGMLGRSLGPAIGASGLRERRQQVGSTGREGIGAASQRIFGRLPPGNVWPVRIIASEISTAST